MLSLTRMAPFSELADLHRDLDALFNRVFGETARSPWSAGFTPAAALRRFDDRWVAEVALPGIDPKDVEVEIVGRTLRVRGERRQPEGGESLLSELAYGRFEREFTIPDDIDAEHVVANYRHGMLELTLPVSEAAKPRRIEVKAEAKELRVA